MKLKAVLVPIAMLGMAQPGSAANLQRHGPRASAHAHHVRSHDPRVLRAGPELGGGHYNPYADYTGPGSAVLNATVRAARDPGVTLELAPDAKETATGGPVGGPPGYDGS